MGRVSSIRHHKKGAAVKTTFTPSSPPPPIPINLELGARLWARFDLTGAMEVVVCDDTTIIKRASVTVRDLRTAFSNSFTTLGREKAIVVSLEAIKAIITAEEVLLLGSLRPEVSALIERLKQQFPQKNGPENACSHGRDDDPEGEEGLGSELPFEFQVLCSFLDSNVAALETQAWSLLEDLTKQVITGNFKIRRSLTSNLTCLLASLQKVRDEIEQLLDDKEDMADLYITRKWIKSQQPESIPGRNSSMVMEEDDVEDLEMLLDAYFIQLENMRNKILMKEYMD